MLKILRLNCSEEWAWIPTTSCLLWRCVTPRARVDMTSCAGGATARGKSIWMCGNVWHSIIWWRNESNAMHFFMFNWAKHKFNKFFCQRSPVSVVAAFEFDWCCSKLIRTHAYKQLHNFLYKTTRLLCTNKLFEVL